MAAIKYTTVAEVETTLIPVDRSAIFLIYDPAYQNQPGWFIRSTQDVTGLAYGIAYVTDSAGANFVSQTQVTA